MGGLLVGHIGDSGEICVISGFFPEQIKATAKTGSPFIELHTGAFAEAYADETKRAAEIERLAKAAEQAKALGIGVNAGHGINYVNVAEARTLSSIFEFNIGHSVISRALFTGIEEAVSTMRSLLNSES